MDGGARHQLLRVLTYIIDFATDARLRVEEGESPKTALADLLPELDDLRELLDDEDDDDEDDEDDEVTDVDVATLSALADAVTIVDRAPPVDTDRGTHAVYDRTACSAAMSLSTFDIARSMRPIVGASPGEDAGERPIVGASPGEDTADPAGLSGRTWTAGELRRRRDELAGSLGLRLRPAVDAATGEDADTLPPPPAEPEGRS